MRLLPLFLLMAVPAAAAPPATPVDTFLGGVRRTVLPNGIDGAHRTAARQRRRRHRHLGEGRLLQRAGRGGGRGRRVERGHDLHFTDLLERVETLTAQDLRAAAGRYLMADDDVFAAVRGAASAR